MGRRPRSFSHRCADRACSTAPGDHAPPAVPGPRRRHAAGSLARRVDRDSALSLTVIEPGANRSWGDAMSVGLQAAGHERAGGGIRTAVWRSRLRSLPRPDVLVVHGAGAWPAVDAVAPRVPTVLHLHELETGLDRCIPISGQAAALASALRVLAASQPVADLAVRRGARARDVEILPGVVERAAISGAEPSAGTQRGLRWVMGAGTPGWRKGTDRLAAVAGEIGRRSLDVKVGWVGGAPSGADSIAVGAPVGVEWFDERPDPWTVLDRADAILIPSREDPLPLIALEAGARGRAVVAMPTGGLPSLLGDGRGVAVPTHDVAGFVSAVVDLLDAPGEAARMGRALFDHVWTHHDAATGRRVGGGSSRTLPAVEIVRPFRRINGLCSLGP